MNAQYFLYQLIASLFLILAGVAVANFMTFNLIELLYAAPESVSEGMLEELVSQNKRSQFKFATIMWVGASVISTIITYSANKSFGYVIAVATCAYGLFSWAHIIANVSFLQLWIVRLTGFSAIGYVFNFVLCMFASYWLFRRSALLDKKEAEKPAREDILDANF